VGGKEGRSSHATKEKDRTEAIVSSQFAAMRRRKMEWQFGWSVLRNHRRFALLYEWPTTRSET